MGQENIHAGHRERMIEKFIAFPDSLSEHELLEILLFYSIPRNDTNVIAHRLIKAFGGLAGVMKASAIQLMQVEGVGKKTATNIVLNKLLIDKLVRVKSRERPVFCYQQTLDYLREYVEDYTKEQAILLLFDKRLKLIVTLPFNDLKRTTISTEIPEITGAINAFKPTAAAICHTHPSGLNKPSELDDYTTTKFMLVFSLNGIKFLDHIILCDDCAYSYFENGRLDLIKQKAEAKLFI